MNLRISTLDLKELHSLLLKAAPEEGAAFLSVEPSGSNLVLHSYRVFQRSELDERNFQELSLKEEAQIEALATIKQSGHGLVEVHTHPSSKTNVNFSGFDLEQLPEFARYIGHKLPGKAFGAFVFGSESVAGRSWRDNRLNDLSLHAVGQYVDIPKWRRKPSSTTQTDERYDRQVRALGASGQQALSNLRVAVVGVGGTGSQVAQQFGHLGVKELIFVDDDCVEFTNLPRLAGATHRDAKKRRRKTDVAKRYVRKLGSATTLRSYGNLRDLAVLNALRDVDLIVGCVDNDGSRLILAELAAAHLVPYIDIGVGIENENSNALIGGRVAFYLPGGACLSCADELDIDEVSEDLETSQLHAIRVKRGYSRDRAVEPALMPLNTVLVGLAMAEVLAFATGVRSVKTFYRYDFMSNKIVQSNVTVNDDCVICKVAGGMGDRQNVVRYALSPA